MSALLTLDLQASNTADSGMLQRGAMCMCREDSQWSDEKTPVFQQVPESPGIALSPLSYSTHPQPLSSYSQAAALRKGRSL